MTLFKNVPERKSGYDPEKESPVIRCSICTGEQSAGFKDNSSGQFREIMPIRSDRDVVIFRRKFGIDDNKKIPKIY